jgi:O-methyltransferase
MNSEKIFSALKNIFNKFGIDIVRHYPENLGLQFPKDFDSETIEIILKVKPFTQTSPERLFALCQAVRYITKHQIPGAIVECGVWRGGSMMAVAEILNSLQTQSRELYLFDTFEGMTEPNQKDVAITGETASELLNASKKDSQDSIWCYAPLEDVKQAVYSIGYEADRIHFVKGKVEETIPQLAPSKIALLRLDTDWYESTRHELIHLFPCISSGGVIIIDDYGHWQGARQAIDEYFEEHNVQILLNRIDYTGRIGIVR